MPSPALECKQHKLRWRPGYGYNSTTKH